MKYDIFESDKDKADARATLPELVKHPGWKFITKTIDANIAYLTDELTENDFDDLIQVKLRQKQLTHLQELKALPETIVQAAQPEPEEEDTDIY
jgi:hypothetical protein